jgi:hypothetical protein
MFTRVNSKCAHQVRPPLRHEPGGRRPPAEQGGVLHAPIFRPADLRAHCTEFVAARDAGQ